MSDDMGLFCYQDGDFGVMPIGLVLKILGPFVKDRNADQWELSFPDGGGGNMMPVADRSHPDIAINRPRGSDLYDAIYEIMRQTHTIMWWTGGPDQITADENIADHLPPGFIEEYGRPALVRSGADILAEIAKT